MSPNTQLYLHQRRIDDIHIDLSSRARELGVLTICQPILNNPKFKRWTGSSKPHQHHYGDGGLIIHTHEVVTLCEINRLHLEDVCAIDPAELFLAALFHDVGKMYDYEWEAPNIDAGDPSKVWYGTKHKRLIHHISRSATMWSQVPIDAWEQMTIDERSLYRQYHEPVLHAILAHHGQRQFGSPVAPKTRVAWLVHLCDGISARMNDADTLDIIDGNQS